MSGPFAATICLLLCIDLSKKLAVCVPVQLTEQANRDVRDQLLSAASDATGLRKEIAAAVAQKERLMALKDREEGALQLLEERIAALQARGAEVQVWMPLAAARSNDHRALKRLHHMMSTGSSASTRACVPFQAVAGCHHLTPARGWSATACLLITCGPCTCLKSERSWHAIEPCPPVYTARALRQKTPAAWLRASRCAEAICTDKWTEQLHARCRAGCQRVD